MDAAKHLRVLEFDKILELLAEQTDLSDSAEAARAIMPAKSLVIEQKLLEQTSDAHILISRNGAPSFAGAVNITPQLKKAALGGVLSMGELLTVADTLRVIRTLKEWRDNSVGQGESVLDELLSRLYPIKHVEESILAAVRSPEEMNDNASPALADIRRKMRRAASDVRAKLDSVVRSKTLQKYLMDSIITQRDGRFVVPVKAEFKAEVPGLVHDISSSGSTLFIEPMAVVEINNELKVMEAKERDEIERILAQLSALVADFADVTLNSYKALVSLNLIFAKARLAIKMRATLPNLNDDGAIELKRARHPLIPAEKVVPIDVRLGSDFDTLIVTGPNTGGKTVSLKTLGLLTAMAMCGLMIPADDGSSVSFFKNIMADIGDEQSIEQSLSTFSSHMKNIVDITGEAGPGSLVLLDELGAGTDPIEGAALATAIISHLRRRGAVIAATTHYAELKTFALDTPGVENASCEFDVKNLSPTYRLLIGTPGSSNAFAISERLRLSPDIIAEAKQSVSEEAGRFERVVDALTEARRAAEEEKEAARKALKEAEALKQREEERFGQLEEKRRKLMDEAREQTNRVIEDARRKADALIEELNDMRRKAEKGGAAEMLTAAKAAMRSGVKQLEELEIAADEEEYVPDRPFKVGDEVVLASVNRPATVLELKDSNAVVTAGNMKLTVKLSDLRHAGKKRKQPAGRHVSGVESRAERSAAAELDLRGMASDEAILALDRFIDSALMSGIGTITVIHGKGTGVLRKAVQAHLKSHRSVRSYRLGVFGEGESGVTIAEIK